MAKRNPETDKLVAPKNFKGPTEKRHCTDILCLLLLFATWTAMTLVGLWALSEGDYRIVVHPMDYLGNICGLDYGGVDMSDYGNIYFINNHAGVCVDKCPEVSIISALNRSLSIDFNTLVTYSGIWQTNYATVTGIEMDNVMKVANYSALPHAAQYECTIEKCFPNENPLQSWTSEGIRSGEGFAMYLVDSSDILQRCFSTEEARDDIKALVGLNDTALEGKFEQLQEQATDLWADVWQARKYVLGFGFGGSFGVSLVYMFLMRVPLLLNGLVWGSIGGTIAMFFAGGYFALDAIPKLRENESVEDHQIQMTKVAGYISFGLGGLFLILTLCLRKAIQTSITCVKEAGKAITAMPLVLIVPILQAVAFLMVIALFMVYGVFLVSLGEMNTEEFSIDVDVGIVDYDYPIRYRTYEFNDEVRGAIFFTLFSLFWTANFITAFGDMTVSMSIAKWYFTREKTSIGSWTVLASLFHTGFYHSGTCAYGSLVIAIIQMIRVIIQKFQKYAKDAQNKLAQIVLRCCACCFWCLEKCIKFLNKNAYIQTAIFSTSFCASAKEAFFLILRNAARFTAVTWISAAVLVIGKLFISVFTTAIGYYLIEEHRAELDLSSSVGPSVVIFLISYFIADFFMGVFDMGISTVLHCLIADEEMFEADKQYADRHLQKYVDDFEK